MPSLAELGCVPQAKRVESLPGMGSNLGIRLLEKMLNSDLINLDMEASWGAVLIAPTRNLMSTAS